MDLAHDPIVALFQKPTSLEIKPSPQQSGRGDLALPIRADPNGRLATVTGDALASQTISTALRDGSNENAFRYQRALGEAMIFDVNDEVVRAKIIVRLRDIFAGFEREKRFRLLQESLKWASVGPELVLSFQYLDLETSSLRDFSESFSGSQGI